MDGYAKTGVAAELTYQHRLHQPGLSVVVSMKGRLNSVVPELIPLKGENGFFTQQTHTSLITAGILAGISYRSAITARWYIEEQLLIGVAGQRLSKTFTNGIQPLPSSRYDAYLYVAQSEPASDIGFSAAAALGPVYRVSKRVSVFLQAEFWMIVSQMQTTGETFSGQTVVPFVYSVSNLYTVTAYSFRAEHLEKNPLMISVLAGVKLKI